MKIFLPILLCLLISFAHAQEKEVELIEQREDNKIILTAINNADVSYNIEVKINLANAKTSVPVPFKQTLEANSEQQIIEITPEDVKQGWSYSIGYSYEKYIEQVNIVSDENTIVVFTMNGCGRCKKVIEYLTTNNINFTQYNTTGNDANNLAMWNKLKEDDYNSNSINMPVILANNDIYYNIPNLTTWLTNLKYGF